jgi:hypothetical protein
MVVLVQLSLVKHKKFFVKLFLIISIFIYGLWILLFTNSINGAGIGGALLIVYLAIAAILAVTLSILLTLTIKIVTRLRNIYYKN